MKTIKLNSEKVKGSIFVERVHWCDDVLVLSIDTKEQKIKPLMINDKPYQRINIEIRRVKQTTRYSSKEHRHVPVPEKDQEYTYKIDRASLFAQPFSYGTIVHARLVRDAAVPQVAAIFEDQEMLLTCNLEYLSNSVKYMEQRLAEWQSKVTAQKDKIKVVRSAMKSKTLDAVLKAREQARYA